MQRCVGVRREDRSPWERRAPITPEDARALRELHGIEVYVQPSPIRVFSESEYAEVGAIVQENLASCPVILAVKEIPVAFFEPDKTYIFFSHVIKGQPHNMPMLRRILDLGCNLVDYERITDEHGRRLIFFGRHAGIAGTLETLWALGRRLEWEGLSTPFTRLRHAHEYHDLTEAKDAIANIAGIIRAAGLPETITPLIIGVTGYGNVARGVWEILDLLPVEWIEPQQILSLGSHHLNSSIRGDDFSRSVFAATFREEHTVAPLAGIGQFDLQHYYNHPESYHGIFEQYVPCLTAVVNGIYWDARYPRLITKEYLKQLFAEHRPRLRVIGDISCDIEGSIECTVRSTDPDAPIFVYNPSTGEATEGYAGDGVVVMAVDILPSELPCDASVDFSRVLSQYIPAIVTADYSGPFDELDLPPEIKRAVIVYRGELTPGYRYLEKCLW